MIASHQIFLDEHFSNFRKCRRVPALAQTALTQILITQAVLNYFTEQLKWRHAVDSTSVECNVKWQVLGSATKSHFLGLLCIDIHEIQSWWDHAAIGCAAKRIRLELDWSTILERVKSSTNLKVAMMDWWYSSHESELEKQNMRSQIAVGRCVTLVCFTASNATNLTRGYP